MKSGALRRAFALTLLYVGIFVALVIVQFSHGPGFLEHIGRLTVSATIPKSQAGDGAARPDLVRISYASFSLLVSSTSPAELHAADGSSRVLPAISLQRSADGIVVQLDGGVALRCSSNPPNDSFALKATGVGPGMSLVLHYTLAGDASLVTGADSSTLRSRTGSYALSTAGASMRPEVETITFGSPGGGDDSLALTRISAPAAVAGAQPAAVQPFTAQAPKDPAAFSAEISAWRDKVWSGLSGARFNADVIMWKGPDGSPAFSERALDALLAEALSRGSYSSLLDRVKHARELYPDKLTYLSAPYLGGLAAKMPVFEAGDLIEVKRIGQQISDKSLDLFTNQQLIHFLLDRAPYSMAQDALRFTAAVDLTKLSIRQAVGLLGCVVEARSLIKDEENPFLSLGAVADRIVSAVQKSDVGYFLASEDDGSTDLRLSLQAGLYLVQYGTAQGKDMLVGVGQSLVEAVLGLADAQGFSPARLTVKAGGAGQKSGMLAPEDLYPLVSGNPYYPHEVSFYRDLAPGVWAWTCSPELHVTVTPGHEVFTVRFPVGASHYLVLYGIKPFGNIQLYDIDYSPDAAFETYDASGFLYHRPTNALYLKMKHKKEVEDVRLVY